MPGSLKAAWRKDETVKKKTYAKMMGIAGEMFSALAAAKINIHMISQGASETSIAYVVIPLVFLQCHIRLMERLRAVVDAEHAVVAMKVLHAQVLKMPSVIETHNAFIKGVWACILMCPECIDTRRRALVVLSRVEMVRCTEEGR